MKEPQGCIYHVVNRKNGKGYVGQHKSALTVEFRWNTHLRSARRGSRYPFHCALRKYGYEKGFTWELVWCGPISKLNAKEVYYIKKRHTFIDGPAGFRGYNLTTGGGAKTKYSKSTCLKISRGRIRWFENPGVRLEHSKLLRQMHIDDPSIGKRIGDKLRGRQASNIAKKACSLGQKRRYEDPVERENASKAAKQRYIDDPGLAARTGASNRGKKVSVTSKNRISTSLKKYYEDPDNREFAGRSKRGKPASATTNEANSVAQKKRWADPAYRKKRTKLQARLKKERLAGLR
jgi:hypothetical protein